MTAALELDRWSDDGGPPADGGPGFAPLVVTLTPDTSRFRTAMAAAMAGLGVAIREACEAMARMANAVGPEWTGWGEAAMWARLDERPVDRARRLRLDRQLRTLARRADRRARIAARRR